MCTRRNGGELEKYLHIRLLDVFLGHRAMQMSPICAQGNVSRSGTLRGIDRT